MSVRAVFFDLGGVIVRTEYQAPRQHLAERLGMEYDDLVKIVFDSDSGYQASIGAIPANVHWDSIIKRLKRPAEELESIRHEFFAGDVVDRTLLDFLRSLRGKFITGLISNAWGDLREYILRENLEDAFDHIIISAEVGVVKPEAKIFKIALEQANVKPKEMVFVDDFPANIEGCKKLGIKGILFRDPDSVIKQIQAML